MQFRRLRAGASSLAASPRPAQRASARDRHRWLPAARGQAPTAAWRGPRTARTRPRARRSRPPGPTAAAPRAGSRRLIHPRSAQLRQGASPPARVASPPGRVADPPGQSAARSSAHSIANAPAAVGRSARSRAGTPPRAPRAARDPLAPSPTAARRRAEQASGAVRSAQDAASRNLHWCTDRHEPAEADDVGVTHADAAMRDAPGEELGLVRAVDADEPASGPVGQHG